MPQKTNRKLWSNSNYKNDDLYVDLKLVFVFQN